MGSVTGLVISPGATGTTEHELYQVGSGVRRQPIVRPAMATTEADGQPALSLTSAQLFAADTARIEVWLTPRNISGEIYIRFDATAVTSSNWHLKILPTDRTWIVTGGACPLEWSWISTVASGNLNWWAGLNGA
jgi:hypothetical protein